MSHTTTPLLTIEITSFSYKAPLPAHLFSLDEEHHGGGFVFDCRSLPNPGRLEGLKNQTGCDPAVRAYLEAASEVHRFRERAFGLVEDAVRNFLERRFTFMNVSFGCTGGQHRSVFMSEQLSHSLATTFKDQIATRIIHAQLQRLGMG